MAYHEQALTVGLEQIRPGASAGEGCYMAFVRVHSGSTEEMYPEEPDEEDSATFGGKYFGAGNGHFQKTVVGQLVASAERDGEAYHLDFSEESSQKNPEIFLTEILVEGHFESRTEDCCVVLEG